MAKRNVSSSAADESFVITVRVKPRSPVSALEPGSSGNWVARLHASPVEGEANAELVRLVAKYFGCARSCVSVISGATARLKLVRISRTTIGKVNGAAQPFAAPDVQQPASSPVARR